MKEPELVPAHTFEPVIFTHIPEDLPPNTIVEKLTRPKEVELPPEMIKDFHEIKTEKIESSPWPDYTIAALDGNSGVPMDRQLVIAIGFPPEYPSRALHRNIEGWAVVGFSVSAAGSVYDPYILESEPAGVFDKASIKAITRFKYKARQVNGRPVSTDGQRYMFTYKIEN
jgi:protein TonB